MAMSNRGRLARSFTASAAVVAMVQPTLAGAQAVAEPSETTPPKRATNELEDVVVTATKRPERLQDVPISVQAVTGDLLKNNAIQNFENIEVPGVRVSRGGMSDTITVRGIGSGQNLGFEQSAPMYIDGVYYGRARTQRIGFLDLDRIEFLKGPQPTFLGKNAIAGAVNITTRKPRDQFGGEIEASFEPVTDEYSIFGAVDVPLHERFAVRAALRYRDSKGYLTNTITGRREPSVEDLIGRLTAVGRLSDNLKVTVSGYFGNNDDHGRNNQSTICEPNFRRDISDAIREPCLFDSRKASSGLIPAVAEDARPDLYTDDDGGSFFNRLRAKGTTMLIDYDVGKGITFSSITGYYQYKNYLFIDTDQGIANFSTATFNEDYDQISQEFRLISPNEGPLEWFVGLYGDKNNNDTISTADNDARNLLPFTPPAVPPQTGRGPAFVAARIFGSVGSQDENAKSWAAFGEASYTFSRITARGGLRYEEVRKDIEDSACDTALPYQGCTPVLELTGSRKDKKLQPAITLEYRPATDTLLYGSFKRGFKSGGFSGTDGAPFDPENVSAYELGLKSKFFDRRVLFNLTGFYGKYTDLQVSSFDPVTNLFATTNAAGARNKGVEAEVQLALLRGLRVTGNLTYLNAKYSNFPNAQCYAGQLVFGTGCNAATNTQNLSGVVTPYAPKWSGSLAADYSSDVANGYQLRVGSDVYFTSKFATLTDINPRSFQKGFAKLNARIALVADAGWEVALVARNFTDKRTASFKNTIPGGFNSVASFSEPPATYTMQVRYKY